MKRRKLVLSGILTGLALLGLAACNLPRSGTLPTPFPTLGLSSTGNAGAAGPTTSAAPATTAPPVTAVPAGSTATSKVPTPQGNGSCSYNVTFVGDVTIPDGAAFDPGTPFVKTWRLKNDGTCTWGPSGYDLHYLVFSGGDQLGGPNQVQLPGDVQPGSTVDVSVSLKAPTAPGTYKSLWSLALDNGTKIGPPLFAQILVNGPLATLPAGFTRVSFEAGATSASLADTVKAGQTKGYVVRASKGQVLMATLTSAAQGVRVALTDAAGNSLPNTINTPDISFVRATLPATADYDVTVTAGSQDAQYSLLVEIPSRISFDPGAISASIQGTTSGQRTVSYLLRALKGQTMTATLTSSNKSVLLTVYGLEDGEPLVRSVSGQTTWTGTLPADQDYVIEAVPTVDITNFTLQVTVK